MTGPTTESVSSSGTRSPPSRRGASRRPSSLPDPASARRIAPLDRWGSPSSAATRSPWVPLPDPGAPRSTIRTAPASQIPGGRPPPGRSSVVARAPRAVPLAGGGVPLVVEPGLPRPPGRAGRAAGRGRHRRLVDQRGQTLAGDRAVAPLGPAVVGPDPHELAELG